MTVSTIPLVTGTYIVAGAAFQAPKRSRSAFQIVQMRVKAESRVQMLGTSGEPSVGVDIRSVAASDTESGLI